MNGEKARRTGVRGMERRAVEELRTGGSQRWAGKRKVEVVTLADHN